MLHRSRLLALVGTCGLAASALAQPQLVILPGQPGDVSDDGTVVVGSTGSATYRWVRGPGGSVSFSLLPLGTGSAVRCSTDGTVTYSQMANNNIDLGVEGASITGRHTSATGFVPLNDFNIFFGLGTPTPPGNINIFRNASRDGRFAAGFGYVSSGIGGYRPMLIDSSTNLVRLIAGINNPAGRIHCLSDDGLVIAGDDDISGSAARPAIWRFNAETNTYVGQIVDPGAGGAGGQINCISADGTKAAGQPSFNNNRLYRWEYNAGTGTYDKVELASALTPPGAALTRVSAFAMSPDGDTIYGQYNQSRAFIWTAAGGMQDLTNILVAEGITGLPTPTTVIGSVQEVSSDGRKLVVVGGLGGASGIIYRDPVGCVQPAESPTTSTTTISKCTTTAILNAGANGTGPFTYAWRRADGTPIVDGPTGRGTSAFTGATTNQMRITSATPLDADTYECTVSNACGSFVISRTVGAQPADPYDTCATALDASGTGTVSLNMCGAYIDESPASCAGTQRADVWIRYTALQAGDYRITNCGQSFDTILSLYNSCGTAETACNNTFCSSAASIERITLTEGQVVYVRVGAGSAVPGAAVNIIFEQLPPPPANDLCSGATVITGNGSYPWNNTFAGLDGAASCQVNSGKDVWFKFWPSQPGRVTMDTCGTTLNTVLSAYDGCGGTQIACNDNANVSGCTFQSRLTDVPVAPGRPILIRIAANSLSGAGAGNLNVTFTPGACLADFDGNGILDPDDLSDAISCFFETPSCPGMNFDGMGSIDPDDLADYIAAYFGGGC